MARKPPARRTAIVVAFLAGALTTPVLATLASQSYTWGEAYRTIPEAYQRMIEDSEAAFLKRDVAAAGASLTDDFTWYRVTDAGPELMVKGRTATEERLKAFEQFGLLGKELPIVRRGRAQRQQPMPRVAQAVELFGREIKYYDILAEGAGFQKALEILDAEDFYKLSHRKIFNAMTDLFDRNEPIDLITLTDLLNKKDEIEAIGGVSYLSSLIHMLPTAANIKYHAHIVREKALVRGLLRSANEIAGKVYEDNLDAEDLVDYAEKSIFEISDKRIKVSFFSLKEVIKDSFEMIEHLYDKKETVTGVPSGFKDLDDLTTGFQKGDLIIIGGRPSMGKTAFTLNIAQHVGVELLEPVAIFSLEMAKEQLALRMLCSEGMVNSNSIRKGFIKKEDWHKLTSAASNLTGAPIFIDDSSAITVLELRAKARRLKMEHGLSLVLVDYLQLMRGKGDQYVKITQRRFTVPSLFLSKIPAEYR